MTKKKEEPVILYQGTTSVFIFLLPTILLLVMLYYIFNVLVPQGNNTLIIVIVIISFVCFVPPILQYINNKIIITDKKIYVFTGKKKVISWHIVNDFAYTNYETKWLGNVFLYGKLILVNNNNQLFTFNYLSNPINAYKAIIKSHEDFLKKQDSSYISIFEKEKDSE